MVISFASNVRRILVLPFALALAASVSSCSGTGEPGSSDDPTGSLGEELFSNDKTMYEFFVAKGLKNFQAAGIVGNLDQESGGNPTAVQPGGPGRGIAQWSVGGRWDTDSGDNENWYAKKQGQGIWSLQLQLEFVWYELTTFSGYGLSQLKATTNVTDATIVFQDKFEGCGTCDQSQRVQYAKNVLAAYGSTPPPAYAAKFVSQTYPYASVGEVKLQVGQTVKGHIVMENVGTATWKAGTTKLAPIPRDKASAFHAASWLSTTRVSTLAADVAPGQKGTFEWDLKGSTVGDFKPYFGFVEEGVTWFADPPKGGGPPDNDVQVHVVVSPAPATGGSGGAGTAGSGGSKGGTGGASAGTGGAAEGGTGGSAGKKATGGASGAGTGGTSDAAGGQGGETAGGAGGEAGFQGEGGVGGEGGAGGAESGEGAPATLEGVDDPGASGGCSTTGRSTSGPWGLALVAAMALVTRRRRVA